MLSEEQRQELEGLLELSDITVEQDARIKELQSLEGSDEDEFDLAFKEATGQNDEPSTTEDEGDEPVITEPEDDTSLFNNTPDPEDQQGDDTDWKAEATRLQEELDANNQKMKSWEGRIKAANKKADEATAEAQKKIEDKIANLPEDESALTEFLEEFPAFEKPIKLLAKSVASEIVEVQLSKVNQRLDSVEQTTQAVEDNLAEETSQNHMNAIQQAHPDWMELRDSGKLQNWINAQTPMIRDTLNNVVKQGTTEQVIEMFDMFKKHNKPSTTTTKKTEVKQSAIDSMVAVEGQTSGPPATQPKVDMDDFDAAWEEAIRKKK